MNIEYVGRNYTVDDSVRGYIEGKLGKVTKFVQEPVEIRVTLETEKHRQIAKIESAGLDETEEMDLLKQLFDSEKTRHQID